MVYADKRQLLYSAPTKLKELNLYNKMNTYVLHGLFFFPFAVPRSLWDLSFPTGDQTLDPWQ